MKPKGGPLSNLKGVTEGQKLFATWQYGDGEIVLLSGIVKEGWLWITPHIDYNLEWFLDHCPGDDRDFLFFNYWDAYAYWVKVRKEGVDS